MGAKKIGSTVMIIVGSLFLALTVFLGGTFCILGTVLGTALGQKDKLEDLKQNGAYAVGYVTEVSSDTSYTMVGFFDNDGVWYEVGFNINSSSVREDDSVSVYYNPYNPSDCVVEELASAGKFIGNIFLIVGIGFGILFGGAGAGLLIGGIIIKKKSQKQILM